MEEQKLALDETRREIGVGVWTSYQTMQAATANVLNSAELLSTAQQSYRAAEHRYQTGIGSVLELLNAQSALAAARRQRIQSLTDWRNSRLQLAAKLGSLEMSEITGQ